MGVAVGLGGVVCFEDNRLNPQHTGVRRELICRRKPGVLDEYC